MLIEDFIMSIIDDIQNNRFIVNDQQIEQLAWQHTLSIDFGKKSRGTIMQIFLAMAQELGGTMDDLTEVYTKFYPAIRRGVEKAGYTGKELESRAGFARSAMSTLRRFIIRGGDLNELDPDTVTKAQLQAPATVTPRLQRTESLVISSIRSLAKTDEEAAIHELESYIAALRALRKELKGSVMVVSHTLERQQHASH